MSFWDSSAVVALLFDEAPRYELRAFWAFDSDPNVWWGTPVECRSAISRRRREGARQSEIQQAESALLEVIVVCREVAPTLRLRARAIELLQRHPIRAADALQLSALLDLSERTSRLHDFVTLDRQLADAARNEGFPVFP